MILCNLDGSLTWVCERTHGDGPHEPASVGKICAWGGHYVATISNEVPEGERDEYARKFAAVDDIAEAGLAIIRAFEYGDTPDGEHYGKLVKALIKGGYLNGEY